MTPTPQETGQRTMSDPESGRRPRSDVLILGILLLTHFQTFSLAEVAALPFRYQDVLRHPLLGSLLPPAGYAALGEIGPRQSDPVTLLLFATALLGFLAYLLVDLRQGRSALRLKWLILGALIVTTLLLPTTKLMLLRQGSGPASYAHDGGVIQTESTIEFLLSGQNPYAEDYLETPMAEWGYDEYRTAVYHYPYLPWTFIFSAPFYLLGNMLGFFDERLVYLALFVPALVAAARLAGSPERRLLSVILLAFNPIMLLDIIFGQNDVFVLAWLIFSIYLLQRASADPDHGHRYLLASLICFGLACASKPTAWFFAPFYGLLLLRERVDFHEGTLWRLPRAIGAALWAAWPALATAALLIVPYILWDPFAFYDDVWRWSSGRGESGYQIWGWGAANFVLALGLVADRFGEWPFWLLELALALPLLLWFMQRQLRQNTLQNACLHYSVLLLAFFYGSRFLNENYLGYILAFLALAYTVDTPPGRAAAAPPSSTDLF